METLNLEQVKEHFKYAKEVRCLGDDGIYNLQNMTEKGIHYFDNHIFFIDNYNGNCVLYQETTNQLAEILTYIFDRGEEVEISNNGNVWDKRKFITFNLKNKPIVQGNYIESVTYPKIRKLTPESLLEPQLSELKKTAEANGMSVEIIFKQK